MTDIQPGQRFTLYNGSGTWGHFQGEVLWVGMVSIGYELTDSEGSATEHEALKGDFQKLIDDGYVEMKE